MAIVQEFDLNMIPDSAPVIVHVNQYDEGEGRFEIHLYDGNVPYVPAAGAEAIIQGTKPDGKGFDYNATLSGSTVTADVTKQMTAVAGVVRVPVVITEGDNVTGTFVFGMDVQRSGLPTDTDMSASEYQIVEQMIEAAEEAEAVATQSAEDAEAWAVGQRSGSDVPPADPTYHNNSKYWAGKAHEELENKADLVDGKVPSSQLPSYVDDVVEGYYNEQDGKFYEESTFIHEITPERSKIYVDLGADITYRWSGSEYIAISNPDIAEDIVTSIVDSTADYPVPTAGETLKVIIGKIKKYLADLKGKLDTFKSKGSATKGIYFDANGAVQEMTYTLEKSVPSDAVFTDTKNTAGSTDTDSKIFLVGATSQAANPQTYSQEGTYINANGILFSRNETVALMRILANIYMLGEEYEVGDYCYSNISGTPPLGGTFLYKCIQGIESSTPQTAPPNGTYWKVVRAMEELSEKGTDLPLEVVNGKLNIIYEEE